MIEIVKKAFNIHVNYPEHSLPNVVTRKIVDLYISNLLTLNLKTFINSNGDDTSTNKCNKSHNWVIDKKGKERNVAYLCVKRALYVLKLDWKCKIDWIGADNDDNNIEITMTKSPAHDNA
jgi:hypothetical protein